MKTLLPVDENTHFCAFTLGRMKPETRADEGSERCCCFSRNQTEPPKRGAGEVTNPIKTCQLCNSCGFLFKKTSG